MDAKLSILCENMSLESLMEITIEINKALNLTEKIKAELPVKKGKEGGRGYEIIGQIALTAFSSGGAFFALLKVVRHYLEIKRDIKIELEREDGKKMAIIGKNLKNSQFDQTHKIVKEFFGASE